MGRRARVPGASGKTEEHSRVVGNYREQRIDVQHARRTIRTLLDDPSDLSHSNGGSLSLDEFQLVCSKLGFSEAALEAALQRSTQRETFAEHDVIEVKTVISRTLSPEIVTGLLHRAQRFAARAGTTHNEGPGTSSWVTTVGPEFSLLVRCSDSYAELRLRESVASTVRGWRVGVGGFGGFICALIPVSNSLNRLRKRNQ